MSQKIAPFVKELDKVNDILNSNLSVSKQSIKNKVEESKKKSEAALNKPIQQTTSFYSNVKGIFNKVTAPLSARKNTNSQKTLENVETFDFDAA